MGWAKGKGQRQETITSWFGYKKRTLNVDYFDRVLMNVRLHEASYFEAQAKAKKTKPKKMVFAPGTTQLKLFANVPVADLEMLFPNSEVRMKTLDKLIIIVPAMIGIATMSAKIIAVLYFMWNLIWWVGAEAGVHTKKVDMSTLAAEAGLVIGASVAIGLFIGRQVMRYRFKKIQFLQALTDNLFVRNLDNNAGAFHRVLDDAQEEEVKEVENPAETPAEKTAEEKADEFLKETK